MDNNDDAISMPEITIAKRIASFLFLLIRDHVIRQEISCILIINILIHLWNIK